MSRTVLIVDDEPDIRDSLRDVLEAQGYAVRLAANGHEGLRLLRDAPPPSVVILDISMPVMSGTDLYSRMQADPFLVTIPVLVSTSDPSRAPSGALVMRKPVNLDRLLKTIADLCG